MGNLFGFCGKEKKRAIDFSRQLISNPVQTVKTDSLFLSFGGIPQTCIVRRKEKEGWAVLGLGISLEDESAVIMCKEDWGSILESNEEVSKNINGHYLIIKWNRDKINFTSDILGIRAIYYCQFDKGWVFSTNLEWIAKFRESNQLDFGLLGSTWLTCNQLSSNSIIKGIKSSNPGDKITISGEKLKVEKNKYIPSFSDYDFQELEKRLRGVLNPEFVNDKIFTFGLSGGFDSRTLISLIFPSGKKGQRRDFMVHVFGEDSDPDVEVAKRIVKDFDIPGIHLSKEGKYDNEYLSKLHSYISSSNLIEPASTYQKLRYFSHKYFKNKICIDGANGEIGRRKFFNRLVRFGRGALIENNPEFIYPWIKHPRIKIFKEKFTNKMYKGTINQIENLLDNLPSAKDFGVENLADLMAVRTRTPYYSGVEQNRLDSKIMSYVPFLQKDIIDVIFSLNLKWRRNGRYYRKIIEKYNAGLKNYPLVKGEIKFPFNLSGTSAAFCRKLAGNCKTKKNNYRLRMFKNIQAEVLSLLNSESFKNFSPYNHRRIIKKIEGFYKGIRKNIEWVDWWYTFEIWRREMGIE